MKFKNYYKTLGLKKTASGAEIKKRYKDLMKRLHPDVTDGNEKLTQKLHEIQEAYEVLGDLDKRLEYSQYFHAIKSVQDEVEIRDYEYRKEKKIK